MKSCIPPVWKFYRDAFPALRRVGNPSTIPYVDVLGVKLLARCLLANNNCRQFIVLVENTCARDRRKFTGCFDGDGCVRIDVVFQ
jgi:hypothetical protein